MRFLRWRFVSVLCVLVVAGCSGDPAVGPVEDVVDAEALPDAGNPKDGEAPVDLGEPVDQGGMDVEEPRDADVAADSFVEMDVAPPRDMAVMDAPDARPDVVNDVPPRDVPDVRDAAVTPDVPPAWGLDTRPRNATCAAFARPSAGTGVTVTRVFPSLSGLRSNVGLLLAPGDATRWYIVEQQGRVLRFNNTPTANRFDTFADISSRVACCGEAGLLGVAFHPSWATNRQVFLSYTTPTRPGLGGVFLSRVSRFVSRDGGNTLDPSSEQVLLEFPQPFSNHNGGDIKFGPDGMLYLAMGDGGSGGDPMRNGQNNNTLLGKFIRIDVDRTSPGLAYGIPADNPFATSTTARREIWATGLRNPWRFSFDRVTGELWTGDVGQTTLEEVDIIRRGGNYGWNVMEGTRCYNASTCNQAGLALPVVEYGRTLGTSITGGYVYRGSRIPWLVGSYVYGDFGSGRLFAVTYDRSGRATGTQLAATGANISTFAEDQNGELYFINYANGQMFRIDPGPTTPTDTVPPTVRATGCVDATNPLRPAAGLIPYAPNAPFWSDGADKERFMALPDGARITIQPDGDWDLPVGTVLVKNFTYRGRRIETRLFVRHADGDWAGYTYAWNDAQTDATLLPSSSTRDLGGGVRWHYPSRGQCMECHTTAAGRTLGLETAQLNGSLTYAATGRTANQLATLEHIGLFAAALPARPAMLPSLPSPTGTAAVEARARAYLHANCANCHRPGGTGRGTADFRYTTPTPMLGVCNVTPTTGDLGIAGARVLLPGEPSRSILSVRVRATDLHRMPPISSNVVDTAGADLLDTWIRSLRACP